MKDELHLDIEQARKRLEELNSHQPKRDDFQAGGEQQKAWDARKAAFEVIDKALATPELRDYVQRELEKLVPAALVVRQWAAEQSEDKDAQELAQLHIALYGGNSGKVN